MYMSSLREKQLGQKGGIRESREEEGERGKNEVERDEVKE